jgi:CheY-like chemotaxis protein
MTPSNQGNGTRSILVVDDDPISRELVALLLGSEGHRVTKASNGRDALDTIARFADDDKPSAILIDMKMPGLSGAKLAERLRNRVGAGVRILAMSASEPASTAHFDGFLRKPIDTAALANLLGLVAQSDGLSATAADPASIMDETVFSKLKSMMPPAAVNEILEACIQDIRHKVPMMAVHLQAGEWMELRQAAHTIKGGSLMIGARQVSAIAAELESGSYQPGEGLKFLEELSSACEQLERILRDREAGRLW